MNLMSNTIKKEKKERKKSFKEGHSVAIAIANIYYY